MNIFIRTIVVFNLWILFANPVLSTSWMRRKPYVQNVTTTKLSILWETGSREKCKIILEAVDADDQWEKVSPRGIIHEVRFTGLAPYTKYRYKVFTSRKVYSEIVRTAPDKDTHFSFLIMGDNRNGHSNHQTVINAMAMEPASFYINTGDLTNDGLKRENWYRFLEIEYPLMKRIPLYAVVGNHENCFGKGEDLFMRYFAHPQNSPYPELVYTFSWGNSRFFVLNSEKPFVGGSQSAWLKSQLQQTVMDKDILHIFVIVHISPFTSGPHGPNEELLESGLVEVMHKYGVDMLFAGHDHLYERGRVRNLNYVVTAGGGAPIYYVKEPKPYSLVTEPTLHYTKMIVKGNILEFSAHRTDGSLIDFFTIKKTIKKNRQPIFKILKEG
nr:metallophosphoesterase [Deltaproteobacteria bacterium]